MNKTIPIKHWAVIVANVVGFLLAFIWYGPLFGAAWAKGAEVNNPQVPPVWATVTSFIVGLLSCYGIAFLLKWTNQTGWKQGVKLGLFISLFFLLQVVIGPWLFAGRFLLFAVNMPYFAICVVIAGAIIGTFQKSIV